MGNQFLMPHRVVFTFFTVFQVREGFQVKNLRNLASLPDKLNVKLKKIWRQSELVTLGLKFFIETLTLKVTWNVECYSKVHVLTVEMKTVFFVLQ